MPGAVRVRAVARHLLRVAAVCIALHGVAAAQSALVLTFAHVHAEPKARMDAPVRALPVPCLACLSYRV